MNSPTRIAALTLWWPRHVKRIGHANIANAARRRRTLRIGVVTAVQIATQVGQVDAPRRASNLPVLCHRGSSTARRRKEARPNHDRTNSVAQIKITRPCGILWHDGLLLQCGLLINGNSRQEAASENRLTIDRTWPSCQIDRYRASLDFHGQELT